MLAKYEEYTNTVRKVPENYCLIHWDDEGTAHFDMDGATKVYRDKIEDAHEAWITLDPYNDKESLVDFVEWALSE
jgi:hypothetical protein